MQLDYLGAGYDQLVFPKNELRPLIHDKLPDLCAEGTDFVQKLLAWGLTERISPSEALAHPYLAVARARGKEERMKMIVQHLLALSTISSPPAGNAVSRHPTHPSSRTQASGMGDNTCVSGANESIRADSCVSDMSLHKLRVVTCTHVYTWTSLLVLRPHPQHDADSPMPLAIP